MDEDRPEQIKTDDVAVECGREVLDDLSRAFRTWVEDRQWLNMRLCVSLPTMIVLRSIDYSSTSSPFSFLLVSLRLPRFLRSTGPFLLFWTSLEAAVIALSESFVQSLRAC